MYCNAIVADSFITVPKLPVIERIPFPLDNIDSINKISPPTLVQARPVTTPAVSLFSNLSLFLGVPKISSTFSEDKLVS